MTDYLSIIATINDTDAKIEYFNRWMLEDSKAAGQYIINQLSESIDKEWRAKLILLAEDCRFPSAIDRRTLAGLLHISLLDILQEKRALSEYEASAAHSAARRYVSLIDESQLSSCMVFLVNRANIDIRASICGAIYHRFHKSTLLHKQQSRLVADRILEISLKVIDKDVLVAGDMSTLAIATLHALRALDTTYYNKAYQKLRFLILDPEWKWLVKIYQQEKDE